MTTHLSEEDRELLECLRILEYKQLAKHLKITPEAVLFLISWIDRYDKALTKAIEQRDSYAAECALHEGSPIYCTRTEDQEITNIMNGEGE